MIPAPMLSPRLDDETAPVLRTVALADVYHPLLASNQPRLARWEPSVAEPPTIEGARSFLEAAGER